jgi:protein tyrosine/serine phosphatase
MVLLLLAFAVGVVHHKVFRWKRFDVVETGKLYRSGMLRDWQLRQAVEKYGVKTVFSFTFENNDREQRTCDELGVERHFCYLHGNGVGPDDPYVRFLEIASNPESRPVLVHCSAGVQRTGGAVALYRSVLQGWGFEQAVAEMVAKGNSGDPKQVEQLRKIHDRLVYGDGPACPRPNAARSPL